MKPEVLEVYNLADEIRTLTNEIEQLTAERTRLERQLEEKILGPSGAHAHTVAPRRGRATGKESTMKRIENLINSEPAKAFRWEEVANRLAIKSGTVKTNLSKLVAGKLIEKRSFSTYGALTKAEEESAKEVGLSLVS